MTSSPGPGTGSSTCSSCKTSGPPNEWARIALISCTSENMRTAHVLWPVRDLPTACGANADFGDTLIGQAAVASWRLAGLATISGPSVNFTPRISFGNWLWLSWRRQLRSDVVARTGDRGRGGLAHQPG